MVLRALRFSSLIAFFLFVSQSVSAQSCGGSYSIPGGASYLYSSVLDRDHSRFLAYRQGDTLRVAEIGRSNGVQVYERFSVPVPAGIEVSAGFSENFLVLSYFQNIQASGDNATSDSMATVQYYRLSDGALDSTKTFAANAAVVLPPKMPSTPFYQSSWQFAQWHAPLCSGNLPYGSQRGRILSSSGSNIVIAHHAEQENACRTNPNYYSYHLDGAGNPVLRAVRSGRDSWGTPVGTVICDINAGFPQVASCVGQSNDTCQAYNAQGQAVDAPAACRVRQEPTPIIAPEHCPTCNYWWYQLDPGGIIRRPDGSYTQFWFPGTINNPNAEPEDIVPPATIRFGPITALSSDPSSGAFALALRTDATTTYSRNSGGIFFFDADGQYTGFGSTFANNGNLAENRSLVSLGQLASGRTAFAAGSGRNIPRGSGGFNIPVDFQAEFRPEGGHVAYFETDGESFDMDFGENPNDNFGSALAAVGDINLDGEPDVLVGAPGGGYASVVSVKGPGDSPARGTMYKLLGTASARFGQQVAGISVAGNGRADVLAVADSGSIKLYDMGNCLVGAEPLTGIRARLLRLIPQALSALAPIAPRRADRNAVNRPSFELHPALRPYFFLIAAIWDALDASTQTLPSNEQQRKTELEASYLAMNGSLNNRDRFMILLSRMQPQLLEARQDCPWRNWRRMRSSDCRRRQRLEQKAADYQTGINVARANITEAKNVATRNLSEIRSELQ